MIFFLTAGREDDRAVQGERECQEVWRPVTALRQLHLVKGDLSFPDLTGG